jgi:hypothetical protein
MAAPYPSSSLDLQHTSPTKEEPSRCRWLQEEISVDRLISWIRNLSDNRMNCNVFDDITHPVTARSTCLGNFTCRNAIRQGELTSEGIRQEVADEGIREKILLSKDGILESHDICELVFPKQLSTRIYP